MTGPPLITVRPLQYRDLDDLKQWEVEDLDAGDDDLAPAENFVVVELPEAMVRATQADELAPSALSAIPCHLCGRVKPHPCRANSGFSL